MRRLTSLRAALSFSHRRRRLRRDKADVDAIDATVDVIVILNRISIKVVRWCEGGVCTDTDANIENDDDFLLFFERRFLCETVC